MRLWDRLLVRVVLCSLVFADWIESTTLGIIRLALRCRKPTTAWFEYLKSWLKIGLSLPIIRHTAQVVQRSVHWTGQHLSTMLLPTTSTRRKARVHRALLNCPGGSARKSNKVYRMLAIAMVLSSTVNDVEGAPRAHSRMFDSDSGALGVDNRCSSSITNRRSDCIGKLKRVRKIIKTFKGTMVPLEIYEATLLWPVLDDDGLAHDWVLKKSYYVPEAQMRLMSPQHWAQTRTDEPDKSRPPRVITFADKVVIEWNQHQHKITVPIDPINNVATFYLAPSFKAYHTFVQDAGLEDDSNPCIMESNVVSDDEDDDSVMFTHPTAEDPPEQEPDDWADASEGVGIATEPREIHIDIVPEDDGGAHRTTECMHADPDEEDRLSTDTAKLLRIHQNYNHISFPKLKEMAKQGLIPKKFQHVAAPACSACLFGKATRRAWRHKPRKKKKVRAITRPGRVVSVDQMKSNIPGLIAQLAGWITKQRYHHATVFVDHYSGFGYVHLQKTASAEETIQAKEAFERKAATYGVLIQHYHADNGIFNSTAWRQHCAKSRQGLTFAGVNAHFQNGVAEQRIRAIQELARAQLFHANSRWPSAINAFLWPYAIRIAMDAINETPRARDRKMPVSVFSSTTVQAEPRHWRPFGCPVYVLDSALQNTGGIKQKWSQRSRIGVYLGRSPQHARSVALVLNLETGRVSPQFHVQFDPSFHTVKESFEGKPPPSLWQSVCGFEKKVRKPDKAQRPRNEVKFQDQAEQPIQREQQPEASEPPPQQEPTEQETTTPDLEQPRRSSRRRKKPERMNIDSFSKKAYAAELENESAKAENEFAKKLAHIFETEIMQTTSDSEGASSEQVQGELLNTDSLFPYAEFEEDDPFIAYAASADPDTFYYHEAMKQPDREKFKEAMAKEVQDLLDSGVIIIRRINELPLGTRILKMIWALKRKRSPLTGEVIKHKGRANIDGSKQIHGRDFWQTYSPTASWSSIRLLLILSIIHGWHTRQIDFVQAFPQAPISTPQYLEIPKGIEIEGVDPKTHVFEAVKNLYGGKDAGRQWNTYLTDKLKKIGFKQSKYDQCLFFKGQVIYVLYTDDSILAGPNKEELDQVIADIKKQGLKITDEGTIADFLGVNIQKKEDGSFHLTQPKLIQSILEELKLTQENLTIKDTPMASSKLLSRHPNSEPFDGHFGYRRVVGMLNYLEGATRGELAYAVHQCARFCQDPKVEHGQALKWIGRYLAGTKDKGLIMKPDPTKGLEMFVDASFCGDFDKELAGEDIDTARSRHGYVITYAGVPLIWKSQLQGEVCLSSTESELVGLSMGMRTMIPIHGILTELHEHGFKMLVKPAKLHCEIFEDNRGALEIAQLPKMRPRTKHINVKYFHFYSVTQRKGSPYTFHWIDTKEQVADIFTKPLDVQTFVKLRKKLLGW